MESKPPTEDFLVDAKLMNLNEIKWVRAAWGILFFFFFLILIIFVLNKYQTEHRKISRVPFYLLFGKELQE